MSEHQDGTTQAKRIAMFQDINYVIKIYYDKVKDVFVVLRNNRHAVVRDMHEVMEELEAIKREVAKRGEFAINLFNVFMDRVAEKGAEPMHDTVFITPN